MSVGCTSRVLAESNARFLVEDVVVDVTQVPHGQVRCKNTVEYGIIRYKRVSCVEWSRVQRSKRGAENMRSRQCVRDKMEIIFQ